MSKVLKGEVSTSSISNITELLEKDEADTTNLINSINNFISDSNNELQGPAYDTAREKLSLYIRALNIRKLLASSLVSACKNAINNMSEYMEGYNYLNDEEIDEIERQIRTIEFSMGEISHKIKNLKNEKVCIYDPSISISALKDQIQELKKLVEKLKGLKSADAAAYSELGDYDSSSNSYATEVFNLG